MGRFSVSSRELIKVIPEAIVIMRAHDDGPLVSCTQVGCLVFTVACCPWLLDIYGLWLEVGQVVSGTTWNV